MVRTGRDLGREQARRPRTLALSVGYALALRSSMIRTCIAVVDASRARLFTYERANESGRVMENLVEQRDLINPARRLRPSELFSDSRPGANRIGRLQYGVDDHRDAHLDAMDAEFSRLVVAQLKEQLRATHAKRVIICASPRMLGELRKAESKQPLDIEFEELARDLVKLTPTQLRDHLAAYGLLPAKS